VVAVAADPYLNALYEDTYPTRHPGSEHINFTRLPFDLGILHYASDTPYTRGKNLGASSLAYLGMDSAYATVVAMVRRILDVELARPDLLPRPVGGRAKGDQEPGLPLGEGRAKRPKPAPVAD